MLKLGNLSKLSTLVAPSMASDAGIAAFQKRLPQCKIIK